MLTAWALLLFLAMWVRSTSGGPLSFRIGKLYDKIAILYCFVAVETLLPTRDDPGSLLFLLLQRITTRTHRIFIYYMLKRIFFFILIEKPANE